jgi:hypothetical protein
MGVSLGGLVCAVRVRRRFGVEDKTRSGLRVGSERKYQSEPDPTGPSLLLVYPKFIPTYIIVLQT